MAELSAEQRAKAYADNCGLMRDDEMEQVWWQLRYQSYLEGFREGQSIPRNRQRILINSLNRMVKVLFRITVILLLGYLLFRLFKGFSNG